MPKFEVIETIAYEVEAETEEEALERFLNDPERDIRLLKRVEDRWVLCL